MPSLGSHADAASEMKPKVGAGGLVTVAFLKARLDEGEDQLGIFSPLILDAVSSLPASLLHGRGRSESRGGATRDIDAAGGRGNSAQAGHPSRDARS